MLWKKLIQFFRSSSPPRGSFVGRAKTRDDTAIKYRMTAGAVGDVTRTHPVDIEPCFPDATAPPTAYGQGVVVDGSSHNVRHLAAGDNALDAIYGITVRPYPTQQLQASTDGAPATFGAAAPPTSQAIDVMRKGYMLVQLGDGQVTGAVKGGRVYLWAVATSGHHVLGGFEVLACSQKTILLDEKSFYNGVEDAKGVVEIGFNI